jgi:hypothetical protein
MFLLYTAISTNVNFGFSTLEEITRLLNIIGGHGIGINIHGCQPNLERAIHVLKSANGNDIMP